MAEPDLLNKQRDILRSFRTANAERAGMEAEAAGALAAARTAVDEALQQTSQQAEATYNTAAAAAETKLQAERKAADDVQAETRRTTLDNLSKTNVAWKSVEQELTRYTVDLRDVQVYPRVQPEINRIGADDPAVVLAKTASSAATASKGMASLLQQLQVAQAADRRRRNIILVVVSFIVLVVIGSAWSAYSARQQALAEQRYQATATAVAISAEATATAVAIVAEAIATASTIAAEATATASAITAEAIAISTEATATAAVPDLQRVTQLLGLGFVFVPAGEFIMGSPFGEGVTNSQRQHTVYLSNYWITETEVTNAQYQICVDAGLCQPSAYSDDSKYNGVSQPVVGVSWEDANAYCTWAGLRLPTEAEWEKAARGTDGRIYPWGNEAPTCDLTNYSGCVDRPAPVGSYASGASPYGVLDMAGNVWEWVQDSHDTGTRVLRGGSYYNNRSFLHAASRSYYVPTARFYNYGIRCVRSP